MNKTITILAGTFLCSSLSFAQCGFSGLNTTYCMGDDQDTLVGDLAGGVFSGPGVYGNIFIPDSAGVGTHQINHNITGYAIDQTGTFAPLASPISGTAVSLSDDAVSGSLPVGFTFNFFGIDYTNFVISSNGFISFDAAPPNGCCSGQVLPNAATPNNLIAFCWQDLDPGNGGQPAINLVQYTTIGTAPNRILVVEFYNVDHFSSGDNVTVQTFLYETSNIIEVHTINQPSTAGSHTQGVENIDGTIAFVVPGRNSSAWPISNDYVAFIPLSCDETVDVTVYEKPTVVGTANPDPGCSGADVTFTGSGADTYTWDNGVTDAVPYTVSATDTFVVVGTSVDGCMNSDTVYLWVNPSPTISLSANDEMFGNDGSVNLTILSGAAPYTFDWDNDGSGDNDDNNDLYGVTAGTYTVTMTDGNGCAVTMSATVESSVGIEEITTNFFSIHPNPSTGVFNLTLNEAVSSEFAQLLVVDAMGRRVVERSIESETTTVDISSQDNGMYYVKVVTEAGTYVQPIVLKK